MTKSQLNTPEIIEAINERIAAMGVTGYYGRQGRRAISWFKNYDICGGAYSVSIGEVRRAVNTSDGYDPDRFDRVLAEAHARIFTEADKVA